MRYSIAFLLSAAIEQAVAQDNTQSSGSNPVKVSNAHHVGIQLDNSCTHKDLGFTGKLGGDWYALYGDNLWCASGITLPSKDTSGFHGMVRNSIAKCSSNPLKVDFPDMNSDAPVAHPEQFVPFNSSWGETSSTGFGGTSLCEVDDDTSLIFYLVNQNDAGLVGAGVGKVELVDGTPKITERLGSKGYWWDVKNGPRYGDVAAYKDVNSEYIHAWGGAPTSASGTSSEYVYQIRVPQSDAFNLENMSTGMAVRRAGVQLLLLHLMRPLLLCGVSDKAWLTGHPSTQYISMSTCAVTLVSYLFRPWIT